VTLSDFSTADEIRKLADLPQQGLLTEEEFQAQRTRLLSTTLRATAVGTQNAGVADRYPSQTQPAPAAVTLTAWRGARRGERHRRGQ
jgi:hypothetical protein